MIWPEISGHTCWQHIKRQKGLSFSFQYKYLLPNLPILHFKQSFIDHLLSNKYNLILRPLHLIGLVKHNRSAHSISHEIRFSPLHFQHCTPTPCASCVSVCVSAHFVRIILNLSLTFNLLEPLKKTKTPETKTKTWLTWVLSSPNNIETAEWTHPSGRLKSPLNSLLNACEHEKRKEMQHKALSELTCTLAVVVYVRVFTRCQHLMCGKHE